ncbi:MAG: alpha/beta hydrolase-fold protein [Rhodothermales bacterium]
MNAASLIFLTATLLLLSTSSTLGQETALHIGEQIEIASAVLGETRDLLIHKPAGYGVVDARFPVLYVLDGEWNFQKTVAIVDHLQASGRIPGLIVVGIPNTMRNGRPARIQDLAPAMHHKNTPGAATQFSSFISTEVIPHIDAAYKTQPYRMLAGHSLGGLFVVFNMLNNPDAFNVYIAMSPSLGRNNQQQVKNADQLFDIPNPLNKTLYLSIANEGGNTLLGTEALVAVLEEKAPAELDWHFSRYDDEDHVSLFHPAIYDALESIFDGWTIPEQHLTDHDVSIAQRHYAQLSTKFGFNIKVPESIYTTLGYRILAEREFSYAQWTFEQQLMDYPESSEAHVGMGDAYLLQGEIDKAATSYQQALQLNAMQERVQAILKGLGK